MKLELKKIPLIQLKIAPTNVRKNFVDSDIDKLAQSLKSIGQTDPLIVVPDTDGKYLIFKGQRRYLAAKKLMDQGAVMYDLDCIVKTLDEATQIKESLVEAVLQKNIPEIDVAKAIEALLKLGVPTEEIKKLSGFSDADYSFYLSLLGLNPPETIEDRNKGETKEPIITQRSQTSSAGPIVTKTGKIDDPYAGLTMAQRSEVKARRNADPTKSELEVIEEVKDYYDTTSEYQGLRLNKSLLEKANARAKESGSNSQKHELEKVFNKKEVEEMFED